MALPTWRKPRTEQTAQDWLPVADRPGGGLALKDGREVRLLEVGSLHLRLRSNQERKRILRAEEELYNGLRFPVMRLTLPVPLDLSLYEDEVIRRVADDPERERA